MSRLRWANQSAFYWIHAPSAPTWKPSESPPTPAWPPLPGLRLSLCGSNTSCRRSHAIPYTCGPETIVAGVQVIPAVIPEQPSILHPAVLVKVIPVSASIVCQVFPLSMRIRAIVIAEPPAVQTPGSLRIPVSASGSNGFLCVTLCMVKANGDPMGIKTVKYFLRSSDIHWTAAFHYFL